MGSLWHIFTHFWHFLINFGAVWGNFCFYNIPGTIILHFWVILLIKCGHMQWNADFEWFLAISAHFGPFSSISGIFFIFWGHLEAIYAFTTFQAILFTIFEWFHSSNMVHIPVQWDWCNEMLILRVFCSFLLILAHFHPFSAFFSYFFCTFWSNYAFTTLHNLLFTISEWFHSLIVVQYW